MTINLSELARDITRTEFVAKDFDTYVSDIQNFIQQRFPPELFNNFVASELGVMLIEATAFALSNLSWYMDRQAAESYLETAVIPTSVARLARLVGYKPTGAVPSTGTIQVSLTAPQPFDVPIPRGSQVSGPAAKIYETSQDVTFLAGEVGPKDVSVVEGVTVEELFVSDGTQGQRHILSRVPATRAIAEGSVEVSVGGVAWTVVDFITFEKTNQVEAAITEVPPTIRFGDGIAGNIPPAGSEIRVTYRATEGAAGTVQAGGLTAFSQPVIVAFNAIPTQVYNATPTSAGSDAESVAKTKALAPRVFRTADRAVTEEDYTTLVESFSDPTFGSVAVGRAVIARGIDEDAETRTILQDIQSAAGPLAPDLVARLESHWNNVLSSSCEANLVSVQILQRDASNRLIAPNVGLARALKTFLEARKEATQTVSVTDGSINLFQVDTTVQVKVLPSFSSTAVLANVQTTVNTFLTSKKFGESVFRAQLDSLLMAIDGVDYVNIQFTQPSTKLDSFGNVIIEKHEVVTLGTTTVTALED